MKKTLNIFIVLLLLGGTILMGASITVSKPNSPDLKWEIGSSQTIEWTTSGLSGSDRLRVVLMQGTNKIGTIADNVAFNASPLPWKVGDYMGGKALIGLNYFIKIKQIGADVTGKNVHPFQIQLKFMLIKPIFKKMIKFTFLPDLTGTITYTLAPHHPEGYNESTFTITVTNTGPGPTQRSTNVGAKLLNFGPDGTHQLAGHDAWWPATVPILQPGGTFTYTETFNFRAPNYYQVVGWVDSEGKVEETGTGETNNSFNTVKFKVP